MTIKISTEIDVGKILNWIYLSMIRVMLCVFAFIFGNAYLVRNEIQLFPLFGFLSVNVCFNLSILVSAWCVAVLVSNCFKTEKKIVRKFGETTRTETAATNKSTRTIDHSPTRKFVKKPESAKPSVNA